MDGASNNSVADAARAVWGASPAGTAYGGGAAPGTREFFESVMRQRSEHEMPWLFELIDFAKFRGQKVLEIGCGAGYDAFTMCINGADYTGIDLTPENVQRTRAHLALYGLNPTVVEADAEALPFADGAFDAIFSNGVLHHTRHIEACLREAIRVLRPGGEVWATVYHRRSIFYWLTLFLEHYLLRGDFRRYASFRDRVSVIEYSTSKARPAVNAYSKSELRRMLVRTGFRVRGMWIRKLTPEDLPSLPIIRGLWLHIPQRVLDRVGHVLGWYVVIRAQKSS